MKKDYIKGRYKFLLIDIDTHNMLKKVKKKKGLKYSHIVKRLLIKEITGS